MNLLSLDPPLRTDLLCQTTSFFSERPQKRGATAFPLIRGYRLLFFSLSVSGSRWEVTGSEGG